MGLTKEQLQKLATLQEEEKTRLLNSTYRTNVKKELDRIKKATVMTQAMRDAFWALVAAQ